MKQFTLARRTLGLSIAAGVLSSSFALAGDFEDATACLIVYVKVETSEPNLTMTCDGTLLRSETVPLEYQLADPAAFKASLLRDFEKAVNEKGLKTCNSYEVDTTWWANCTR